ncbi:hypothetical protein MRX96_016119 [Rhipicephalus microplus]
MAPDAFLFPMARSAHSEAEKEQEEWLRKRLEDQEKRRQGTEEGSREGSRWTASALNVPREAPPRPRKWPLPSPTPPERPRKVGAARSLGPSQRATRF